MLGILFRGACPQPMSANLQKGDHGSDCPCYCFCKDFHGGTDKMIKDIRTSTDYFIRISMGKRAYPRRH